MPRMNVMKKGQAVLLLVLSLMNFILISFIVSKSVRFHPLEISLSRPFRSFTRDECKDKDWKEEPIVNPFLYSFRLNEQKICFKKTVGLVLAVPSSRSNFDQRQAIRETWGRDTKKPNVKGVLLFFIGSDGHTESVDIQERINKESTLFSDIVQSDYIDSYRNLTLKSMSILKWFSIFCRHAEFLFKADDDLYVNLPKLFEKLKSTQRESDIRSFILGHAFPGALTDRNNKSKWYTPKEVYPGYVYPPFVSGTAYSMSRDAALALFQAAMRTPFFWLEDVFITGICAKKANVVIIHNPQQTTLKVPLSICRFRNQLHIGHNYSVNEIRKFHQDMQISGVHC